MKRIHLIVILAVIAVAFTACDAVKLTVTQSVWEDPAVTISVQEDSGSAFVDVLFSGKLANGEEKVFNIDAGYITISATNNTTNVSTSEQISAGLFGTKVTADIQKYKVLFE